MLILFKGFIKQINNVIFRITLLHADNAIFAIMILKMTNSHIYRKRFFK